MSSPVLSAEIADERNLDLVLEAIHNNNLVVMVGSGLVRVAMGGGIVTYDHYMAEALAAKHGVTDAELRLVETSFAEATLNDVVSVCIKKNVERYGLYYDVAEIIEGSDFVPPLALRQLAQMTDINLLVTCTCDPLLESALRDQPHNLAVCGRNEKKIDLPENADSTRLLYYLMGKARRGNQEFAICDEDLLRFIHKLHDSSYRPKRLFDAFRENHLLLLGVNFGDWLARFFLWLAKDRENLSMEKARKLKEYMADERLDKEHSLKLFLQHFSHPSTIIVGSDPAGFVAKLHAKWSREKVPQGAKKHCFVSYSREPDAPMARTFVRALQQAGFDVWFDIQELEGGDNFNEKIRYYVSNCALFLPLFSAGSLQRKEGYFRSEWAAAQERDTRFTGTGSSCVIPIIVDRDSTILNHSDSYPGIPQPFRSLQMYHCPQGNPTEELISCLRKHLGSESLAAGRDRD
jgi:hypothetical protein